MVFPLSGFCGKTVRGGPKARGFVASQWQDVNGVEIEAPGSSTAHKTCYNQAQQLRAAATAGQRAALQSQPATRRTAAALQQLPPERQPRAAKLCEAEQLQLEAAEFVGPPAVGPVGTRAAAERLSHLFDPHSIAAPTSTQVPAVVPRSPLRPVQPKAGPGPSPGAAAAAATADAAAPNKAIDSGAAASLPGTFGLMLHTARAGSTILHAGSAAPL